MNHKAFVLTGRGSVGKSTTIHRAYELLTAQPQVEVVFFEKIGYLLDFIAVILIRGKKVGLVNRGDLPRELQKYLKRLQAEGCLAIVCATRTRGGTFDAAKELDPPYEVEFVEKSGVAKDLQTKSNLATAKKLVSLVQSATDARWASCSHSKQALAPVVAS